MALTSSDESAATSDITWLKLLEEKAVSDHLPGILGQAYLLKAKLAIGYDDNETLQESIRQISILGGNPNLDFLNDQLTQLLERV